MAARIVHASARSKDRVPAGRIKALCGQVVARREVRKSGVTCPMCLAVAANTTASTASAAAPKAATGDVAGRGGGGRR